jgi:hypothetical protein
MSRPLLALLIATVGISTAAAPAVGQTIEDRRGFWLAGAVTGSSVDIDCERYCPSERISGISGYVQFGGTPSRLTLAGAEFNGWYASDSEAKREYLAVMGVGYWFPSVDFPFFLKLGIGAGRYAEETADDELSATGFAIQLGTGYDFRISTRLWAAPVIQYIIGPDQNAKRNRFGLSTGFNLALIQLGAKVSWH